MGKQVQVQRRVLWASLFLLLLLAIPILPVSAGAPVADFTGLPTSGTAPLSVLFTDSSLNIPTGWAWFFGDENYTQPWTPVNGSAGWSARYGHSSVVMPDGSIVLMGGFNGVIRYNDVWRSTDNGTMWTRVNLSAGWSARYGHRSVVLPDGSIVLMGGYDGLTQKNDVWRSMDSGAMWTQVNASAGWLGRSGHTSVAMPDGSIVLMGGYVTTQVNDTWRSMDNGATWTRMNASSGWTVRSDHSSVALPDGSIVLMGGSGNNNNVWRSTDYGATWTQMTASAEWPKRYAHMSVAMPDGSIVLMGGYDSSAYKDVWRSTDYGAHWTQVNASAGWSARSHFSSVVLRDGTIAVMGGFPSPYFNDVWRFMPTGSSIQNPSHTYTMPGIYPVALQAFNSFGYNSTRKTGYITVTAPPAPVAGFTGTPTSGTAPLSVSFTDSSLNGPSGWAWFFGDENYLAPWIQANASAGWTARQGHTSVAMPDGSIVLMGGSGGGYKNDVWRSTDNGATWTQVNASAGWTARQGHTSVAMPDGSIVLMGGYDISPSYKNDTWRSMDNGVTWSLMNASSGWSSRYLHSSTVMPDGSIILTGGGGWKNDTWRSTDNGATWIQVNTSSGWTARNGHTSVAMPDGSIVLMGGWTSSINKNDVWRSTDNGATWTQVNAGAEWSVRSYHCSVAMPDGSIVLMGGAGGTFMNDVWRSTDSGATWIRVNASAGWSGRSQPSSVVMPDGTIVLMGGGAGSSTNNVWQLTPTGSSLQNPSHTYITPGIYQVALQAFNSFGYNSTRKTGYITVTAPPAPVAGFTGTPTSGTAPVSVSFTDSSLNGPSGWAWFFGDENFTAPWTLMNASPGWSARYGHTSVTMPDGSIVLMGGWSSSGGYKNDTWRSTDYSVTWTRVNASSGWTARQGHTSVVMPDGSIVLTGGKDSTGWYTNDVWRSTDNGATWSRMNASAGWSVRNDHSCVVLPDGSIVLMGGYSSSFLRDVWRSTDNGATWTQMTASATWLGRYDHTSVAMPDGSIVLMGGYDSSSNFNNNVWRSTNNGATWTEVNASAGWTARGAQSSVMMPDGSIVLMGGQNYGVYNNNVWRSTNNGATWTQVNASAGWVERQAHSSVAMPDGSIVLMGGSDGSGVKNDTWRFVPTGSSLQNPSHTYTTPGIYPVALQAYNAVGYNSTRKTGYITVSGSSAPVVNGTIINQSATFYIGEQGLNVTHALNQAQGNSDINSVPPLTKIGWWASGAPGGAAPTKIIDLSGRYTSLTAAPADFVGYTGNWYVMQNDLVNTAGQAFIVTDPALDIRVWDFDHASDVTGTSVPQGTRLGFRIDTNMYGAVYNRSPINPGTDGFINITVKNASNVTLQTLYNGSMDAGSLAGPNTLLANFVNGQPYFWGSTGTYAWKTDARDNGTYIYPAGTYTVMAESTLNHMKDNYKNGGFDYTGKTISPIYSITLVSGSSALAANFTATPKSGTAPLNVSFTDTSTGTPTSWNWCFGDGGNSTLRNPSHTFASAGAYSVNLSITNASGSDYEYKVNYITVSSGGGGNEGGGGDSGTGDSSTPSSPGAAAAPAAPAGPAAPAAPAAPSAPSAAASGQAAGSYPMGFEGMSYNAEGDNTLSLDLGQAEVAGAAVTMYADHVNVYQHSSPGVLITFWSDNLQIRNRKIQGTVKKAEFATDPLPANLAIGNVSGSIRADLLQLTQRVTIDNTINGNVSADLVTRFRGITALNNLSMDAVAYTMDVRRGNLSHTGAANVTLTIPPAWVNMHGGKDAVRIARISDETGITELVSTIYTGTDNQGNMVFRGDSPKGSSIFGMLTAKATAEKQLEQPNVTVQPLQKPAIMTDVGMFAWLLGIVEQNPLLIVVAGIILAVAAYLALGKWKF